MESTQHSKVPSFCAVPRPQHQSYLPRAACVTPGLQLLAETSWPTNKHLGQRRGNFGSILLALPNIKSAEPGPTFISASHHQPVYLLALVTALGPVTTTPHKLITIPTLSALRLSLCLITIPRLYHHTCIIITALRNKTSNASIQRLCLRLLCQ